MLVGKGAYPKVEHSEVLHSGRLEKLAREKHLLITNIRKLWK
jgi:hypothetical protein